MADVSEMLTAIEEALDGPTGPRRTVLPVHQPRVLGVKARYLGMSEPVVDGEGRVVAPPRPLYGLTRRGCRKVRAIIHEAARADMGQDETGHPWRDLWVVPLAMLALGAAVLLSVILR